MPILLACRAGFEKECAAEFIDQAATQSVFGYVKTNERSGFVTYYANIASQEEGLLNTLVFREFIFIRHWCCGEWLVDLNVKDRLTPLLALAKTMGPVSVVWPEFPDTNDGKQMGRLAKSLAGLLTRELGGQLNKASAQQLHLFVKDGQSCFMGTSRVANAATWAMGIPRLRMPTSAPSRSTLKLDEAILWFLPEQQAQRLFRDKSWAVDLGAAPGGWSWQLVRRGLRVIAVDNGPMGEQLMSSGQVIHYRQDAFLFEPERPVQWLVCDIADKPARVAELMGKWLEKGWTRQAIFNLKLPMKQRYPIVQQLLKQLSERLLSQSESLHIQAKQLYHDREEITVFVRCY